MKKIGIDANTRKPNAVETARKIFDLLTQWGANPSYSRELSQALDIFYQKQDDLEVLLVIGGDGTVLNRAYWAMQTGTPLLGINLGHVGFLNNVDIPDLEESLKRLLDGEYELFSRSMLEGVVAGYTYYALNDFLLYKEHYSNTIDVRVQVNGVHMATFACDGTLVSTPTGSTAYSLSAGGPIVAPNVKTTLITPICPHTLSARSMLIAEQDVVTLEVTEGHCSVAQLIVDGQCVEKQFVQGDCLQIRTAEKPVQFVSINDHNFFELARRKIY